MQKKTLLLISCSQVLMDITKKILERDNYNVRCAAGIAGTREILMDLTPDGIILEKELADGSGLDYCRELRESGIAPILLVSGSKWDKLPALKAGAKDFLKKPYDCEILKSRIEAMLCKSPVMDLYSPVEEADTNVKDDVKIKEAEILPPYRIIRFTKPGAVSKILEFLKTSIQRPVVRRFSIAATAFSLIFAFSFFIKGLGVYETPNTPEEGVVYLEMPEVNVPLGAWNPGSNEPENDPAKQVQLPMFISIWARVGEAIADTLLMNPEENTCYLIFEITLASTGELLYKSELLAPGASLERITLLKLPELGWQDIQAKIQIFAEDNQNPMVCANVDASITVK